MEARSTRIKLRPRSRCPSRSRSSNERVFRAPASFSSTTGRALRRMDLPTLNKPTTGRRKVAQARVRLVPGSGQHRINGRPMAEYFPRHALLRHIEEPLVVTHREGTLDIVASTTG